MAALRIATWNINSLRLRVGLLDKLVEALNPDVICLQETKVADEEFPVLDAYLVDRDQLASFAQALRDLDEREPEIEMVCICPWPPYSFARAVDLNAGAGAGGPS